VYRPQCWRARRPDSAWRSREPEGTRGDVGCGVDVVVEGEGRRSNKVYGMLSFESREARVNPAGPAPRTAIREVFFEAII
jgi:hypothetical protein